MTSVSSSHIVLYLTIVIVRSLWREITMGPLLEALTVSGDESILTKGVPEWCVSVSAYTCGCLGQRPVGKTGETTCIVKGMTHRYAVGQTGPSFTTLDKSNSLERILRRRTVVTIRVPPEDSVLLISPSRRTKYIIRVGEESVARKVR